MSDQPGLFDIMYSLRAMRRLIWTRKVAAKTVTARLTPQQAALLQRWTRNMRQLDRLVRTLQALGLRAAAAVTGAS